VIRGKLRGCVVVAWLACAGASGCAGSQTPDAHELPSQTSDPNALFRIAVDLAERGDLIRAEQYALLAVENGFPPRRSLPLLLSVCLRSSRVSSALAHAEPVLRAFPSDQRLRYLVASIYAALHRNDDALRELAEVVRAEPGHVAAASLLVHLQEEAP
jgi:predicted Zn-dependent protease